ncbi:hypothetical protein [Rodentibacter ratti]|uniref:hypothetical protein n=1 Tax=Rodentibacter ratti TaxID=1906745 RepID=UPI000986C9DF|nr:hypothetical protein [Rodentibacter ratti]
MPEKHDIALYRGDDTEITVSITDDDGVALPLEGVRADLHALANRDVVLRLSTDDGSITIANNDITLHFNHDLTAQAEWKSAKYDLQITDTQGKVKTLLAGTITLTADITKI